jgi:hypothetical protein
MSRFTDPVPVARQWDHRRDWESRRDAALNNAIADRTRLAMALRNYITAVQVGDRMMILACEEEAIHALQSVGGFVDAEPVVAGV